MKRLRCAIYTRKSSEEGLEQDFNSLDAQREACEAYIKSQAGEGWRLIKTRYDDGGVSGGTLDRPGLQALLTDIEVGDNALVFRQIEGGLRDSGKCAARGRDQPARAPCAVDLAGEGEQLMPFLAGIFELA
ncbi:MAG: recombinase family protein [Proteobacteria bacterium]|nr:recombinase family protein [Pseudomonadota bacterium]